METCYGDGAEGLVWSPCDTGDRIVDPILRAPVGARLAAAQDDAKRVLSRHHILLLAMAKDLLRHRILEGPSLQLWLDPVTGDAPRDPDDPPGRRKAAGQAAVTGMGEVIDLAAHRPDAP